MSASVHPMAAKTGNVHKKSQQTESHNLWFSGNLPELCAFQTRSGSGESRFEPRRGNFNPQRRESSSHADRLFFSSPGAKWVQNSRVILNPALHQAGSVIHQIASHIERQLACCRFSVRDAKLGLLVAQAAASKKRERRCVRL